jgi:hypothetical protein
MIQLSEEYKVIAKEYKKKFGYGVPLRMIPPTTETGDLILKIKECIDSGEDKLLEMYGVSLQEADLV